jgi:hypothetical protein
MFGISGDDTVLFLFWMMIVCGLLAFLGLLDIVIRAFRHGPESGATEFDDAVPGIHDLEEDIGQKR